MPKVLRQCPVCHTEVEDTGGFCLLGHRLTLASLDEGSMTELRDEVDRAFEEARVEVSAALSATVTVPLPAAVTPPPAPSTTMVNRAPAAPPPPPPPSAEWQIIDSAPLAENDPIAAFAPPPRMDWGPEGQLGFLKSIPRLRRPSQAPA